MYFEGSRIVAQTLMCLPWKMGTVVSSSCSCKIGLVPPKLTKQLFFVGVVL